MQTLIETQLFEISPQSLTEAKTSERGNLLVSGRLQAAQTILDRVGLGKSDRIDVNHKSEGGLFILPSKQEVIIDGEYEEA